MLHHFDLLFGINWSSLKQFVVFWFQNMAQKKDNAIGEHFIKFSFVKFSKKNHKKKIFKNSYCNKMLSFAMKYYLWSQSHETLHTYKSIEKNYIAHIMTT